MATIFRWVTQSTALMCWTPFIPSSIALVDAVDAQGARMAVRLRGQQGAPRSRCRWGASWSPVGGAPGSRRRPARGRDAPPRSTPAAQCGCPRRVLRVPCRASVSAQRATSAILYFRAKPVPADGGTRPTTSQPSGPDGSGSSPHPPQHGCRVVHAPTDTLSCHRQTNPEDTQNIALSLTLPTRSGWAPGLTRRLIRKTVYTSIRGRLAARLAGVPEVAWGIRTSNLDRDNTVLGACARLSAWVPDRILSCSAAARQAPLDGGGQNAGGAQ